MAQGLSSVRLHRSEARSGPVLQSVTTMEASAPVAVSELDPESAARRILNTVIGPTSLGQKAPPEVEFKSIGVATTPFAGGPQVKFRQYYKKIPVYGSLVSIQLDKSNAFVSINSTVGDPSNVNSVAKLSPAEALDRVCRLAGYDKMPLEAPARPFFYYDKASSSWRLVYIVEDVLRLAGSPGSVSSGGLPEVSDFVIDAQNGELVDELPRASTIVEDSVALAVDSLGKQREIAILTDDATNSMWLHDRRRNIHTHDFRFADALLRRQDLPGDLIGGNIESFEQAAVSAHANAMQVVDFLRDTLQRDGLDGLGGPVVSSIHCTYALSGDDWPNAALFQGQMIYGQRRSGGTVRSFAAALDVVSHELLHGLTDATARLEYRGQVGALNESISDIFAVIIDNLGRDIRDWNWDIGEQLSETGLALRNIEDPASRGQPAHMDKFIQLPEDRENDWGGVHKNSGIHNKAAYNVLTSEDGNGPVFTAIEVARLYYLTLVAHLSRTSDFTDCRESLILAARNLYPEGAEAERRVDAIKVAYDAVGIVGPAIS